MNMALFNELSLSLCVSSPLCLSVVSVASVSLSLSERSGWAVDKPNLLRSQRSRSACVAVADEEHTARSQRRSGGEVNQLGAGGCVGDDELRRRRGHRVPEATDAKVDSRRHLRVHASQARR